MKKTKALALGLMLGLVGIIYAAGNAHATRALQEKEKAASCCAMAGDSCCAKAHKSGQTGSAKECCKTERNDASCCAAMAKDGKAKQSCCGDAACCNAQAAGAGAKTAAHSCATDGKDNAGCCSAGCCKDGSCGKDKVARQ